MKSSERAEECHEKLSEVETIDLAEGLIFKIKIIYSRPIFEGDTPEEALAIRQEWQDLVAKIGKKGVLATIDYLLSGHHAVPSFPPSPMEFRKCYRVHVASSLRGDIEVTKQQNTTVLKNIHRGEGYQKFQELVKKLRPGYLESKSNNSSQEN